MTVPFVSVLVPTQDRRTFLPQLLRYFRAQTWPADRLELVVVDDGRDPVADLVAGDRRITYAALPTKVPLGTKRNHLVELAKGEILVHMDDDDWYPPERVARAVAALHDTGADVVGRSDLAFWDRGTQAVHLLPRIGPKHACASTMAYRRSYWDKVKFAPDPHGEERQFLKCFDAHLAQLPGEPWDTVLGISHGANVRPKNTTLARLPIDLADVVTDADDRAFYLNLEDDDW